MTTTENDCLFTVKSKSKKEPVFTRGEFGRFGGNFRVESLLWFHKIIYQIGWEIVLFGGLTGCFKGFNFFFSKSLVCISFF